MGEQRVSDQKPSAERRYDLRCADTPSEKIKYSQHGTASKFFVAECCSAENTDHIDNLLFSMLSSPAPDHVIAAHEALKKLPPERQKAEVLAPLQEIKEKLFEEFRSSVPEGMPMEHTGPLLHYLQQEQNAKRCRT